jgi:hypothetical protein
MHVFNAWRERNPVARYEEQRCVDCRRTRTEGIYDFAAEGVVSEAAEELGSRGTCAGRIDRGLDWTGSGGRVMTEALDEARRRRGVGRFVDIPTRRYRRGVKGMDSARRRLESVEMLVNMKL